MPRPPTLREMHRYGLRRLPLRPERVVPVIHRRAKIVWAEGLLDIARAVATAMVAWILARQLLGHELPAFAAIAAIVSLAPGIVSHRKQAVGMMIGVISGILVSDVVLAVLPVNEGALKIGTAAFISMSLVAMLGLMPIMVIQSGVSASLVASGLELGEGFNRVQDALVGGVCALLVSQVLLTPDPFRRLDEATAGFVATIAKSLEDAAAAVPLTSSSAIERAFDPLFERLQRMHASLDRTRSVRFWTLRGRLAGDRLDGLIKRRRRGVMRVGVATLALGEALRIAVRSDPNALAGKAPRLEALAVMCATVETKADTSVSNTPSAAWTRLADEIDDFARSLAPKVAMADAKSIASEEVSTAAEIAP